MKEVIFGSSPLPIRLLFDLKVDGFPSYLGNKVSMMGGILLIALAVFGLSWLFGFGKPERFVKFIIWLVFGPVLLSLLYSEWLSFFFEFPFIAKAGFLVAIPFLLLFALKLFFPNSTQIRSITDFIWNLLVFLLTFPFRLFWRSSKQISERERNRIRLQRYRPVVGGRAPLRNKRYRDLNRWRN